MDDKVFLEKFLTSNEIELNRYSCLMQALSNARKLTGRNTSTGEAELNIFSNKNEFMHPYSFIGLINYLLILEMLGEIFKLNDFTSKKKNNIYFALKQFTELTDFDINTIISLRNSLAHNFGLINIPKDETENSTKRHKFIIINFNATSLIEYPLRNWDGDFRDKSDESSTKISYEKLTDLVELVYSSIVKGLKNGSVTLKLNQGIEELKARFTIII